MAGEAAAEGVLGTMARVKWAVQTRLGPNTAPPVIQAGPLRMHQVPVAKPVGRSRLQPGKQHLFGGGPTSPHPVKSRITAAVPHGDTRTGEGHITCRAASFTGKQQKKKKGVRQLRTAM